MTLTKSQITDAIAKQNGFTRKKSTETVETILELIKSALASGDDVLISGFGKFCVKEKTMKPYSIYQDFIQGVQGKVQTKKDKLKTDIYGFKHQDVVAALFKILSKN